MPNLIAITIGDINGIGIDIFLKVWKAKKIKNCILFSDIKYIKKYFAKKSIKIKINEINDIKNFDQNKDIINIFSYNSKSIEENTFKSLKYAYQYCKEKKCIGMITLPLRKDLIKEKINKNFIGHTEYFQKIDKKKYTNMLLFHKKIIVSPLTTHIEIKKVSKIISNKKFLYNQIFNLYKTLKIDFNIKEPKIIISGLNPHAGENGTIGNEEKMIIAPIIKKLQDKKIYIDGPYSADSVLIKKNLNKYHCFVFIYHDQALIPFKYISQFSGVNYTGNLNIIRTSPDHGTAYDLKKSGQMSDKSFINCYKLIKKIYRNRMIYEKS